MTNPFELGDPLNVKQVASLLGVSPWSIRQLLRKGIPHVRNTRGGKVIFFRNQVLAWVITQQRKGGTQR